MYLVRHAGDGRNYVLKVIKLRGILPKEREARVTFAPARRRAAARSTRAPQHASARRALSKPPPLRRRRACSR